MVDPTGGIASSGAANLAGSTIGWARNKVQAHRAINRAIRQSGLHPGTYSTTIVAWLKGGGVRHLGSGEAATSLTAAVRAKSGNSKHPSEETLGKLANNLRITLNELEQGTFKAALDTARHDATIAAIKRMHNDVVETDINNFAVVRTGTEIAEWVHSPNHWRTLCSHLTDGQHPKYGKREHDEVLDGRLYIAAAAESDIWESAVILAGPSKSGKTRSLLEAIARFVDDYPLVKVVQPLPNKLHAALAIANKYGLSPNQPGTVNVILIDDLQFVPDRTAITGQSTLLDQLDSSQPWPRLLEWTLTPTREIVIVAATTWPSLTTTLDQASRSSSAEAIADQFERRWLTINDTWTATEFNELDAAFRTALSDEFGEERRVASTSAGKPIVQRRLTNLSAYNDASNPNLELDTLRRAQMVKALLAFALRRHDPTKSDLLEMYRTLSLVTDGFEHAFQWATTSPLSGSWAIANETTSGGFRLADYLWEQAAERYSEELVRDNAFREGATAKELLGTAEGLYQLDQQLAVSLVLQHIANSDYVDETPIAWFSLGVSENDAGRVDEARDWYRKVIESEHRDQTPRAMINLGVIESDAGRVPEARDWYRKAIDSEHPDYAPKALYNLGVLVRDAGHFDEARIWFQNAIDSGHPDYAPKAMDNLGVLESIAGRFDEARMWFQSAIDSDHPDNAPTAMYNLGYLESDAGRFDEARTWYRKAIDSGHPDYAPQAMVNLGVFESGVGHLAEACRWYRRAIDSGHPDHALKAANALGVAYRDAGRFDGARAWFQKAIDSGHPEQATIAMINLGFLEYSADHTDAARKWWRKAADLGQPELAAQALNNLRALASQVEHMDPDNTRPHDAGTVDPTEDK